MSSLPFWFTVTSHATLHRLHQRWTSQTTLTLRRPEVGSAHRQESPNAPETAPQNPEAGVVLPVYTPDFRLIALCTGVEQRTKTNYKDLQSSFLGNRFTGNRFACSNKKLFRMSFDIFDRY